MKILYKFASRSRPAKLLACIANIKAMSTHPDYTIMVTADVDDASMRDIKLPDGVIIYYGISTGKVNAINRDMPLAPDWDILINMSDDMEFIKHGFDTEIVKDFQMLTSTDAFIHYPDQAAGEALCTMSIMGREYYDRFGYIYHPDYKSLFCDNEAQDVAKILRRYKFIKKRLFNHNHPAWGLCATDEQYIRTEAFYYEDKVTYERRKANNFDL